MINPNLRFLRFNENTYRMKNGLCNSCGHATTCPVRSEQAQQCSDYQPVLAFKSLAGTEGEFNTFRLGGAWYSRVRERQRLALLNHLCEKVGDAVVTSVHCGPKEDMIAQFAAGNHLMIAAQPEDPVAELTRKIRNLYGTNFMARAELMTVIKLKRI